MMVRGIRLAIVGLTGALCLQALVYAQTSGQAPPSTPAPAKVQSGQIDVENGKLFYEMAGKGETIVLIHDGLIHHEIWDAQFATYAKDRRVVRYDRRGYGRSSPPEKPFSNVEDLRRLFEQLGIDHATLMGMSAGGGLAIDFALKYPQKVSMLVLVGAVVSGFDYTDHMYTRGGHLTAADMKSLESVVEYWAIKDPYEIAPENQAAKERAKRLLEANPQNLDDSKHSFEQGPDRPALPNLGRISIPVLIVVGEEDIPDVHAHAGAIAAGIPGARRVVIPGAGHLVPLEKPAEFDEQVFLFMKEAKFLWILRTSGVVEAVKAFHEARRKDPQWTPLGEARMNRLGYTYLQEGRTDEAIELFKLNVLAYPGSWNVHDSLGEAYMKRGDRNAAIENYRKSLALDPNNRNAVERLSTLEKE